MDRKKKEFKIPKPPGRGMAFMAFTKIKYDQINSGNGASELSQLPFSDRSKALGELWKVHSCMQ
jgi:hypothetical protein